MKAQFDKAVQDLTDSIVRAAHKINDSDRAEQYIREKIALIYEAGQHVGSSALVNEIFNEEH
jgi:predicted GTPase